MALCQNCYERHGMNPQTAVVVNERCSNCGRWPAVRFERVEIDMSDTLAGQMDELTKRLVTLNKRIFDVVEGFASGLFDVFRP